MYKVDLEKAQEPEIKLTISVGSQKKQGNSRKNISFCFTDYAKVFECVGHNKLWKTLKQMGISDHSTCLLRNPFAGKKQQLEPDVEQRTGSKLGKEYIKAVCYHHMYLTYM